MKVVQVVPSIQGESAGPSYSVSALVEGISQNGCEMELHFLDSIPSHIKPASYKIVNYPRHDKLNLSLSLEMLKSLKDDCQTV